VRVFRETSALMEDVRLDKGNAFNTIIGPMRKGVIPICKIGIQVNSPQYFRVFATKA
jgi:hypothetical protein